MKAFNGEQVAILKRNGSMYMAKKTITIKGVPYLRENSIGQGGGGTVFRAINGNTSEKVAIKVIKLNDPKHPMRAKDQERARREASWCLGNNGKNVIQLHDFEELGECLYLVMPLYENTLRGEISRGIGYEKSLDLMAKLCLATDDINQQGVIHRDIKPENILISSLGEPVLTDFGISHFPKQAALTTPRDRLANRDYCAPEQRLAASGTTVTPAVDTYALGMILFELITGRPRHGSLTTSTRAGFPFTLRLGRLIDDMCAFTPRDRIPLRFAYDEISNILDDFRSVSADAYEHFSQLEKADKESSLIEQAVQDTFMIGDLAENQTLIDSNIYNLNYHQNVRFHLSSNTTNQVKAIRVLSKFRKKFEYESGPYSALKEGEPWPDCYQSGPTEKMRKELDSLLRELAPGGHLQRVLGIGIIRKLFDSCSETHCEELLRDMPNIYSEVSNESRGPILWLLKYLQSESPELLNDLTAENAYLYFEPDFKTSWPLNETSEEEREFTTSFFLPRLNKSDEASLRKISDVYPSFNYWVREPNILVRFEDRSDFEKFHSLTLAGCAAGSLLEVDFQKLLSEESPHSNSVQLKWDIDFDLKTTLPKIVPLFP